MKVPGGSLFGLLATPALFVVYKDGEAEVHGAPSDSRIVPSRLGAFGVPAWFEVNGCRLYPSRYEMHRTAPVVYHATQPPHVGVEVVERTFVYENNRTMRALISAERLPKREKRRRPSQNQMMGESATKCATRLLEQGVLSLPANMMVRWHWCHLIATSLWPVKRAQTRRNILLGTAAANGQMHCIERALKWYVRKYSAVVSVEITATFLRGTPLGLRLRYQLYDRKTKQNHSDYFDLFNASFASTREADEIAKSIESGLRP